MNLEELKRNLREAPPPITKKTKKNKVIEDCSGYYTLPCSKEPFYGEVIKLTGHEFYVFFQKYSQTDEDTFRGRLERMDDWLADKPHRVQINWLNYVPNWLQNKWS